MLSAHLKESNLSQSLGIIVDIVSKAPSSRNEFFSYSFDYFKMNAAVGLGNLGRFLAGKTCIVTGSTSGKFHRSWCSTFLFAVLLQIISGT